MFNLFGNRDPKVKLQKKYEALLKESYNLSKTDRTASDRKAAEADVILKEIEALD